MGAVEPVNHYPEIMEDLRSGRVVLIDGGTGTEIERRGIAPLDSAWSSSGAIDGPDVVRDVHRDYLSAGARVIISNTFSTSMHALRDGGIEEQFEELNRQGVELVVEACAGSDQPAVVAAGLTNWSWTDNRPSLDSLRTNAIAQAKIMADAGAELFILEMMSDVEQTAVLLEAVQQTGLPVWVGFSCAIDGPESQTPGTARLLHGPTLAEGVASLEGRDVPVVMVMHTEVADIDPCLDVLDQTWQGPVGVYAHTGYFQEPNWIFNGVISPEDYADYATGWLARGVQIIGGCCGIGPEHIELLGSKI